MQKYKVVNPILHCDLEKYQRVADFSRKTWMSNNSQNVFSFFYQGGAKKTYMKNDVIHLECQDKWSNSNNQRKFYTEDTNKVSTLKMLLMFEYCLNNFNFDFMFRTSSSTYVHYDSLLEYLKSCNVNFFYGGGIAKNNSKSTNYKKVHWVFGHGILMSKDFVELAVKNKDKLIEYNMIDDAALGHFASNFNIKIKNIGNLMHQFMHRCKPAVHEQSTTDNWVKHISNCFISLQNKFNV